MIMKVSLFGFSMSNFLLQSSVLLTYSTGFFACLFIFGVGVRIQIMTIKFVILGFIIKIDLTWHVEAK